MRIHDESPDPKSNRLLSSSSTTRADGVLRAAALTFACATGYNSVVAIRDHVPGEPLGIRTSLSVSTGILVGWGSAVAAPWPMPALALLTAARQPGRGTQNRSALICAGIGVAGIVGILIAIGALVLANLVAAIPGLQAARTRTAQLLRAE